ncbi:esterase family protein [Collinsella sp. AGMB00827]|uniref:Esterase family protein n=1 Tax=Collinsella ureilytica TaxID=2869515 RepID=A0ABS7MJK8_9ACTN|nr:alpha/beta hydrolase family protein [Collinsella urealyticum]MBY4797551.1 esterase family protein [Collinsella urealyticum]
MIEKRIVALAILACSMIITIPITGCTATEPNSAPTRTAPSAVQATSFYSPVLGIDWNYDVYLPRGYDAKSERTYPVLYMLHGLYGNHRNLLERFNSQQMLDGAMNRSGTEAIVVFVDGFNSFYVDSEHGMQMETAIMDDLIPFIQKTYRVSPDRAAHAIGGISMGGYGAARLALKHSDQFGAAIMVSPSVWQRLPEDNAIFKSQHAFSDGDTSWSWDVYDRLSPAAYLNQHAQDIAFYVATTADDGTVPVADVDVFVDAARTAGADVTYRRDTGDNHNWAYWTKTMPGAYAWVLDRFEN